MQVDIPSGTHMQYRLLGDSSSKELIGIGFMRKDEGKDFEDACTNDFSIIYVLCGSGKYVDYRGKTWPVTQGSFFMRFPNLIHTNMIEPGEEWYELFLAFGPQQCKAFIDMGFLNPDQPVGFIGSQPVLANRAWELLNRLQKADQSEIPNIFNSISGLLFDMLEINKLGGKTRENVMLVEKVSEYISGNLQKRITINDISHQFGVSNSKLRKNFKQIKGVSIGNYLIRKRIEESFKYLCNPDISIGEIAEKLGYNNIYDFSNQFKKLTGHPPSHYRNII